MVETRYIKIDYGESINAKKQILASEISLIEIIKRINNYRLLRKKELETKLRLKASLYNLKSDINSINATFPEHEQTKTIYKGKKAQINKIEKSSTTKKQLDFQNDIEEIQAKLARLG